MITIKNGNIFTSTKQTIVNPINCVGVMGAGIALEFKLRYPYMFMAYKQHCDLKRLDVGKLYLYKDKNNLFGFENILNFPTKKHWRDNSHPAYITSGLKKLLNTYKQKNITSIAIPLLGAGRGG